ncbi:DUF927 domain-containing protein [Streptomyces sp. NPDC049951]|uniref:DUF927 domain-containing protein n=1 Tax=Streptomyces sp. NPDC049951 TaxID=3156660 RepID=UPI00343F394F
MTTTVPQQAADRARTVSRAVIDALDLDTENRACVPEGWALTGKGVFLVRPGKGDLPPTYERITTTPLVITRILTAPDGGQSVELAWTVQGRAVRHVIPHETAKRGRELIKALGALGLPTSESYASPVEKWLLAYEDENSATIPRAQLRRWLGWQPDGTFLSAPDGVDFQPSYESQATPATGHRPAGTLKGWQETAELLEKQPIARLCVAAGLGSPLLRPLGVGSTTVDISGFSGRGKTTAAEGGISTFMHPLETGGAAYSWASTLYMVEERMNLVRGLPVLLDESQHIKPGDRDRVGELLYMIPTNRGRSRAKGWNSGLEWECVIISTGEQSLLTMNSHQGVSARVHRVEGEPMSDATTANAVRAGFTRHHGHAGPAFVAKLTELLATDGGAESLKARHDAITAKLVGDNPISARRSRTVAVFALAEILASEWEILPYAPMSPDEWLGLFAASAESDNRPEQALNVVREHIATRMHELWSKHTPDLTAAGMSRVPTQWLGAYTTRNGEQRIAVRPEAVKEVLQRAGFELAAVIGRWVADGYVSTSTEKSGKVRPRQRVRIGPAAAWLIEFTSAGFPVGSAADDDE